LKNTETNVNKKNIEEDRVQEEDLKEDPVEAEDLDRQLNLDFKS
jgi:hypothetical protein